MHGGLNRHLFAFTIIGSAILATEEVPVQCCIGSGYVAGELLVTFHDGTTQQTVESVAESAGSSVIMRVFQFQPTYLLRVPIGEEPAFLATFQSMPIVRYAELNAVGCFGFPPCTCCPCGYFCDNLPDSCPECTGDIPERILGHGPAFTVEVVPGGQIRLTWGPPCSYSEGDFALYEGTLGDFTSHVAVTCTTDGHLSFTFDPAVGDAYYLVVPRTGSFEGSYGTDSRRLQRPPSASACLPQGIATACC